MVKSSAARREIPVRPVHVKEKAIERNRSYRRSYVGLGIRSPLVERRNFAPCAWDEGHIGLPSRAIIAELPGQCAADDAHLLIPVKVLDNLFRAERDEHANDDDAHFAGELAPAVQRLR